MTETGFAELISMIAHELRSPLTSIKGFSATLVKRWDRFTEEQRLQFVQTINSDADRMSRIISEILDLARIEAGKLELLPADAHVASAAEKAVAQLSTMSGSSRVTLDVAEDLTAWADPERLERAIATLVENALKFSEEGPIEVAAGAAGDDVVITVADKGVGIAPERLESIFAGPGPSGQMAGPKGTGLGLHLAQRLVEAQRGTLTVDSEPGVGTTFTMTLPRTAEDGAS